jgi:metal-responsive CopG/Arc/MetJ family transcriptional regulator
MAKVMVSLPNDLLQQIDREVQHRSTSRSAFLAAAAERELLRRDPEALVAAVARSEARFEQSGVFDSARLVRADRDARR